MYSNIPSLVLGFHGCDRETARKIITDPTCLLHPSKNSYDWLGNGMYFWENSPQRAIEWAQKSKKIKDPYALGAIIDLGNCLNLTDIKHALFLEETYKTIKKSFDITGKPYPENTEYKRDLDCIVINAVDCTTEKEGLPKYDSVRSPFIEGKPVYPNAGFFKKSHIQICIRNQNCIKGYFNVRNADEKFDIP